MSINRKAWTAVVAADIAIDAAAHYSTAMLGAAEGIASTLGALLDRSAGRPGKNDPQAEAIKAWGEMKAEYVAAGLKPVPANNKVRLTVTVAAIVAKHGKRVSGDAKRESWVLAVRQACREGQAADIADMRKTYYADPVALVRNRKASADAAANGSNVGPTGTGKGANGGNGADGGKGADGGNGGKGGNGGRPQGSASESRKAVPNLADPVASLDAAIAAVTAFVKDRKAGSDRKTPFTLTDAEMKHAKAIEEKSIALAVAIEEMLTLAKGKGKAA